MALGEILWKEPPTPSLGFLVLSCYVVSSTYNKTTDQTTTKQQNTSAVITSESKRYLWCYTFLFHVHCFSQECYQVSYCYFWRPTRSKNSWLAQAVQSCPPPQYMYFHFTHLQPPLFQRNRIITHTSHLLNSLPSGEHKTLIYNSLLLRACHLWNSTDLVSSKC